MGKFQIPLLIDHHLHPYMYAALRDCIDLRFVQKKEDALSILKTGKKDDINVAIGWNNSLYSFTDEEIDPVPPSFILNASLHSYTMNKPAVDILRDKSKEIVDHLGDREWAERNFHVVVEFAERLNPCTLGKLKDYCNDLLKQGVWFAEEMLLIHEEEIGLFKEAGLIDRTRFWVDISTYKTLSKDARKHIHGIKIFTDGAFGSKTANIKTPFLTGETGIQVFSDDELRHKILDIAELGIAVAIHAIGDGAVDQVIGIVSNEKEKTGSIPEIRIEHSQLITRSNAERAKQLGIILSMQPNFNVDSLFYTDRLPEKYIRQNNPFRMLIDDIGFVPGKDLIFGSDGMPYGIDDSLKCSLFPPNPSQKLTLDEYIAGYCMPDMENGHIEIEIDDEKQLITTEVVVKDKD